MMMERFATAGDIFRAVVVQGGGGGDAANQTAGAYQHYYEAAEDSFLVSKVVLPAAKFVLSWLVGGTGEGGGDSKRADAVAHAMVGLALAFWYVATIAFRLVGATAAVFALFLSFALERLCRVASETYTASVRPTLPILAGALRASGASAARAVSSCATRAAEAAGFAAGRAEIVIRAVLRCSGRVAGEMASRLSNAAAAGASSAAAASVFALRALARFSGCVAEKVASRLIPDWYSEGVSGIYGSIVNAVKNLSVLGNAVKNISVLEATVCALLLTLAFVLLSLLEFFVPWWTWTDIWHVKAGGPGDRAEEMQQDQRRRTAGSDVPCDAHGFCVRVSRASGLARHERLLAEALQGRFRTEECMFCFEKFQFHGGRKVSSDGSLVRLLRCGHMFDEACWRGYVSYGSNFDGRCPVCRARTSAPAWFR